MAESWLDATRASYDADAGGYAEQVHGLLERNAYLRASLVLFAELVRGAGGGPVVDVGCGPGYVTRHLATSASTQPASTSLPRWSRSPDATTPTSGSASGR